MPKYYVEILKWQYWSILSASAIFALLNDVKNISDVTKMQQQCNTVWRHDVFVNRY